VSALVETAWLQLLTSGANIHISRFIAVEVRFGVEAVALMSDCLHRRHVRSHALRDQIGVGFHRAVAAVGDEGCRFPARIFLVLVE
jgi:hypothetical protein